MVSCSNGHYCSCPPIPRQTPILFRFFISSFFPICYPRSLHHRRPASLGRGWGCGKRLPFFAFRPPPRRSRRPGPSVSGSRPGSIGETWWRRGWCHLAPLSRRARHDNDDNRFERQLSTIAARRFRRRLVGRRHARKTTRAGALVAGVRPEFSPSPEGIRISTKGCVRPSVR